MRVGAIVEARMRASRLPGKVLMTAGGKPLLQILVERLQAADGLDAIVIATTTNKMDDPIVELAEVLSVDVYRGSEDDVLGRVCGALQANQIDVCVEVTADCPLCDPQIVDEAVKEFLLTRGRHPYLSNSYPHRAVPAGLDVSVFEATALYQLEQEPSGPGGREHVTFGFYRPEIGNRWNPRFIRHESCVGGEHIWVSVDYPEDYELVRQLHEDLSPSRPFYSAADIIKWVKENPELHERCLRLRDDYDEGAAMAVE